MRYFFRSVRYAFTGIYNFFRSERNGQIQGVMAMVVCIAGAVLHIRRMEWVALLLCMLIVISLEMINSSIERLCDLHSVDYHPAIKHIKDVAAGAVLWAALFTAITGAIVFIPHLWRCLQ